MHPKRNGSRMPASSHLKNLVDNPLTKNRRSHDCKPPGHMATSLNDLLPPNEKHNSQDHHRERSAESNGRNLAAPVMPDFVQDREDKKRRRQPSPHEVVVKRLAAKPVDLERIEGQKTGEKLVERQHGRRPVSLIDFRSRRFAKSVLSPPDLPQLSKDPKQ